MEGEINNFIMVWSSILISSCYCYGTTKLVPKGTIRFFMFLPVLCLFLNLPLYLNTFSLSIPTAFFITWLTVFKLLLLVFGTGPLSSPSLSLFHFVLLFILPTNLQGGPIPKSPKKNWTKNTNQNGHHMPNGNTYKTGPKPPLYYAKKGLFLIFLIILGYFKENFSQNTISFLICIYIYIGLEVLLGVIAVISEILLGTKVDPPFNDPYLATSLQDFWGRRWNRVASNSLRATIFYPTLNYTSRVLGRKWAAILALVITFFVSELMHELLFYYLGRDRFGWGAPLFFLFHGLCVVIESTLKRRVNVNWRLPQIFIGPLIFGFVIWTFMSLALPELLELNIVDKVLGEYAAVATFVKDLGLACGKMGRDLLVNFTPISQNYEDFI